MGIMVVLSGFGWRKTKPNKANLANPKGVEQRLEAGCQMSINFRKKEEM
jgi:hypothetical protein